MDKTPFQFYGNDLLDLTSDSKTMLRLLGYAVSQAFATVIEGEVVKPVMTEAQLKVVTFEFTRVDSPVATVPVVNFTVQRPKDDDDYCYDTINNEGALYEEHGATMDFTWPDMTEPQITRAMAFRYALLWVKAQAGEYLRIRRDEENNHHFYPLTVDAYARSICGE